MRTAGDRLTIRPIKTMMNHATTEVFFDGVELPADALIGEEGKGFRYILDGMNAERMLIASECIGDGRWFVEQGDALRDRSASSSGGRSARTRACSSRSRGRTRRSRRPTSSGTRPPGSTTRVSRAARRRTWPSCSPRRHPGQAANACLDTHGGYGFAAEYDVERKFRETRLYSVAPISNNLVLAYRRPARPRHAAVLLGVGQLGAAATDQISKSRMRTSVSP